LVLDYETDTFEKPLLTISFNNLICIGSKNGMNQYDFHLTSWVVFDDYDDGILSASVFQINYRIQNTDILYEIEWVCENVGICNDNYA